VIVGITLNHSFQNLSSSRPLSKTVKIGTQKNMVLPVVLYGCEPWSLTLREDEKYGLETFENRVLRRIFRPRRD
jgi:hypothetical protein